MLLILMNIKAIIKLLVLAFKLGFVVLNTVSGLVIVFEATLALTPPPTK